MDVMLREEYDTLNTMGNLIGCNVPEHADAATVWAVRREFGLRVERLAREWSRVGRSARKRETHPGVSLAA
jgi:hypothetical protein